MTMVVPWTKILRPDWPMSTDKVFGTHSLSLLNHPDPPKLSTYLPPHHVPPVGTNDTMCIHLPYLPLHPPLSDVTLSAGSVMEISVSYHDIITWKFPNTSHMESLHYYWHLQVKSWGRVPEYPGTVKMGGASIILVIVSSSGYVHSLLMILKPGMLPNRLLSYFPPRQWHSYRDVAVILFSISSWPCACLIVKLRVSAHLLDRLGDIPGVIVCDIRAPTVDNPLIWSCSTRSGLFTRRLKPRRDMGQGHIAVRPFQSSRLNIPTLIA